MQQRTIIAIDGYSSCGKSTLAKQLAQKLGFAYIDSGAMYRVITLHFIRNNVNLENQTQVEDNLDSAKISFKSILGENKVYLNDEDVSAEIREMYISEAVSKISPIQSVRKVLVKLQQDMGNNENLIMDGRDIGTHVFPNAQVKLFMTAEPQIRAARRYSELKQQDPNITFDQIFDNLKQRDYDDTTRQESPLLCAPSAVKIDNSYLNMEEQLEIALQILQSAIDISSLTNL